MTTAVGAGVHRIVELTLIASGESCARCAPNHPHNVVVYCVCGKTATGREDHIWTVTARDSQCVSLAPSFNWLNDPRDPSKGSHLHEFVSGIPSTRLHATRPPRVLGK